MNLSYRLCVLWALTLALTLSTSAQESMSEPETGDIDGDGFLIDEHFADFELDPWKHPLDDHEESADEANHHDDHHKEDDEIHFNSTDEPLMLFSTGLSIKAYWMRSKVLFDVATVGSMKTHSDNPPVGHAISMIMDMLDMDQPKSDVVTLKARSTIVGVDMDPISKEVFWVELGKDAGVYSTILDADHFESHMKKPTNAAAKYSSSVVDSGLLAPEDIALDLVAHNIYITDAGLPGIVVCTQKHSHCKILVKDNIYKPRAIIVDSTTGWLIYSDWGEPHVGIHMVSMDGRRHETLIDKDVVWPNALASDHSSDQLYWADAKLGRIERIDLKTRKRYQLVKEISTSPFSLTQFENRIYWSDWAGNDIRTCDKTSGNNTKSLMQTDNIYGIHIFHPNITQKQVELYDPCWSKHCSHMCLISPITKDFATRKEGSITATCACPDSMKLGVGDKSTCYESHGSYLLINAKDYVAQMFPERIGLHTVEKVIYSRNHSIHDIALNPILQKMYIFDAAQKRLHMVDLKSHHLRVEPFMNVSHSIKGLLFDAFSNNLFWLDPENGTLSMCLVQAKFELLLRKGLDRPTSLVLDSRNRVLYIALAGNKPRIIRADILGSDRLDLAIVDTDITTPVAMQLDEDRQRLYWADASHETIESIDLDIRSQGSGVKADSRIMHHRTMGRVTAFVVYNDSLLWTVKRNDYIFKSKIFVGRADQAHEYLASKADSQQQPLTYKLPQSTSWFHSTGANERTKMILVDPRYHFPGSPCWSKDCKYGCVLDAQNSPICICPDSNRLEFCEDVYKRLAGDTSMVWLIVLLLLLSITGLITLVTLLILYRQGRFPTQVSQFSVSFISPNRNKDGAMLLLDTDG